MRPFLGRVWRVVANPVLWLVWSLGWATWDLYRGYAFGAALMFTIAGWNLGTLCTRHWRRKAEFWADLVTAEPTMLSGGSFGSYAGGTSYAIAPGSGRLTLVGPSMFTTTTTNTAHLSIVARSHRIAVLGEQFFDLKELPDGADR